MREGGGMTPDEVRKYAETCRTAGVRVLDISGVIRLEMEPRQAEEPRSSKAIPAADVCKCGHAEHAHMNGLCVLGCDVEKCETQHPGAPTA